MNDKPETEGAAAPVGGAAAPASPAPGGAAAPPATTPADPEAPDVGEWGETGDDSITDDRGLRLPVIAFLNGNPEAEEGSARWFGGFFLDAEAGIEPRPDSITNDPATGWAPFTLRTRKGAKVPGWIRREVPIVVIRSRRCWIVKAGAGDRGVRFAASDYDAAVEYGKRIGARPRGTLHVAALFAGLPSLGMLALRGVACKGYTDRNGWAERARRLILDPANAAIRRTNPQAPGLPLLRFRFTIGVALDPATGEPVWETVGQGDDTSEVTSIVLIDPTAPIRDPAAYFVGRAVLPHAEGAFRLTAGWATEWAPDKLRPGYPATVAPGRPAPTYAGTVARRDGSAPPAPPDSPDGEEGGGDEIPF